MDLPGKVLFFLGGGGAAAGAPWPGAAVAASATPGSAPASCCCCGDISGLIWSCWSPSRIPKNAADEFDAITSSGFILTPIDELHLSFVLLPGLALAVFSVVRPSPSLEQAILFK
jgi:hypothetical protein